MGYCWTILPIAATDAGFAGRFSHCPFHDGVRCMHVLESRMARSVGSAFSGPQASIA